MKRLLVIFLILTLIGIDRSYSQTTVELSDDFSLIVPIEALIYPEKNIKNFLKDNIYTVIQVVDYYNEGKDISIGLQEGKNGKITWIKEYKKCNLSVYKVIYDDNKNSYIIKNKLYFYCQILISDTSDKYCLIIDKMPISENKTEDD